MLRSRKMLRLEALETRTLFSINVSGLHHEQIKIDNPGNGAVIDLTGATLLALEDTKYPIGGILPNPFPSDENGSDRVSHAPGESSGGELYPLTIKGSSSGYVVQNGSIIGQMNPQAPWAVWKGLSDGAAIRTEGSAEVKGTFVDNVEDGYDPRGPFNVHDVYFDRIHDDMVENDAVFSGSISNSFMRGHTFLSARGTSGQSAPAVVRISNVVVELMLQRHDGDHGIEDMNHAGGYPFADGLGNGALFKWQSNSGTVDVRDSVFLVNRYATSSMSAMKFAPGTYSNVTVVWLGDGDYPYPAPRGVTITRDRSIYDRAVAAFFEAHPQFAGGDTTPPPPSTTSSVVGRQLFYNNSLFDGKTAGAGAADDGAIAPDKTFLLSGAGKATFTNVSSYSSGINGVMVDIAGSHGSISADDFTFRIGNSDARGTWSTAPSPSIVTVRAGAGVGGSDRVELIWPDGRIKNTWLEVTLKANADTGLATSDVFYIGSRVGDSGSGNVLDISYTDASDVIAARMRTASGVPISNVYDFNRDGSVDSSDAQIVRANGGELIMLDLRLGQASGLLTDVATALASLTAPVAELSDTAPQPVVDPSASVAVAVETASDLVLPSVLKPTDVLDGNQLAAAVDDATLFDPLCVKLGLA